MRLFKLVLPSCFILVLLGPTFTNILALQIPVNEGATVKIGLLIQNNKSEAARQGAEMAILKANEKGGYNGNLSSWLYGQWKDPGEQAPNKQLILFLKKKYVH